LRPKGTNAILQKCKYVTLPLQIPREIKGGLAKPSFRNISVKLIAKRNYLYSILILLNNDLPLKYFLQLRKFLGSSFPASTSTKLLHLHLLHLNKTSKLI
jgi:hypothetical protein